jgi:hypothetical protein
LLAQQQEWAKAIVHYNKSLFAMKLVFENDQDGGLIKDQESAVRFIKDIEIPVCLNLGLAYNKTESYPYSIKYCS